MLKWEISLVFTQHNPNYAFIKGFCVWVLYLEYIEIRVKSFTEIEVGAGRVWSLVSRLESSVAKSDSWSM